MRTPEAILFDLDGTLIDSIELILSSYEHTLRVHEKSARDRASILAYVGVPLRTHLAEYSDDEDEILAMVATYRTWNFENHDRLVRPFQGIAELLSDLRARGIPIGIVTSKMRDAAWRGLRLCGIADDFDVLIGADDVDRHKPHPAPVLAGCARLGRDAPSCAYVGDSVHDMVAARAAGTLALGAGWGPFEHEALREAGADRLLNSPHELLEL